MRHLLRLSALGLFGATFAVASLAADQVVEVRRPPLSSAYLEMVAAVETLEKTDPAAAVSLCEATLEELREPVERFDTVFWCLSFLYAETGQHERSLQVLRTGQKEGFFYPLSRGERAFPPFIETLAKLEGFQEFFEANSHLRETTEQPAKAEYLVRTPEGYTAEGSYPLLLVLHGGFGSHQGLAQHWASAKLRSEFVVAYIQGIRYQGSFLRSYGPEGLSNIVEAFRQITKSYAVDEARVVLAGQSAGARRALLLAADEAIPAAGLVLLIPVVPRDFDPARLEKAAQKGLRAALLTGEHDPRLPYQKKLGVWLDEQAVPNRFVVFPEKGHEFPEDFSHHLDVSLTYVLQRERGHTDLPR